MNRSEINNILVTIVSPHSLPMHLESRIQLKLHLLPAFVSIKRCYSIILLQRAYATIYKPWGRVTYTVALIIYSWLFYTGQKLIRVQNNSQNSGRLYEMFNDLHYIPLHRWNGNDADSHEMTELLTPHHQSGCHTPKST